MASTKTIEYRLYFEVNEMVDEYKKIHDFTDKKLISINWRVLKDMLFELVTKEIALNGNLDYEKWDTLTTDIIMNQIKLDIKNGEVA
jgi:hypothetical protein